MILKICVENGYRYLETKDFQVLTEEKEAVESHSSAFIHINSSAKTEEKKYVTILVLSSDELYVIDGDLIGWVLNDKGQTVERL